MTQPPDDRRPLPWEPAPPAALVSIVALIFLGGQISQILSSVGTSI